MRPSDWYWLCWLVIGFGAMETIAIATGHREWTLSNSVWRLRDLCPIVFKISFGLLAVWLIDHFFNGKTRKDKDEKNV